MYIYTGYGGVAFSIYMLYTSLSLNEIWNISYIYLISILSHLIFTYFLMKTSSIYINTTILSNDRMPQGLQNEIYDKPTPITCAMCRFH